MKKYIKIALSVFVGLLLASSVAYGLFRLVSIINYDHRTLQQVVTFLNQSIEAQKTK